MRTPRRCVVRILFAEEPPDVLATGDWERVTSRDGRSFLIWRNSNDMILRRSPYALPKGDSRNEVIYELKIDRLNRQRCAFMAEVVKDRSFGVASRDALGLRLPGDGTGDECIASPGGDFEVFGHVHD